jgi:hypothetical protein
MIGGSGWGGEVISRVGRAEKFSGDAGLSFLAQFGSAHLRSSDRASHLGSAERSFSGEMGTAQHARTGLTNTQMLVQVGISEVGWATKHTLTDGMRNLISTE